MFLQVFILLKRSIAMDLISKNAVLTKRIFNGGWEQFGNIKRKPDSRTTKQLLNNIDYFAEKFPEVAQFKKELKSMNPKHLGLVSDICELANSTEMINKSIDIKKGNIDGKSFFKFLMEKLPKISKENPEALDLSRAIIDNSDSIASKYALASITPLFECKEAAPHIKATIPLVGDIADATLKGGVLMDFSKEQSFVDGLNSFISPSVQLEKLEMLPKIIAVADKAKTNCKIEAFPFLTNKTPVSKISENLETFKQIDGNIRKDFNLTDFLEKNVNLK